MLFRSDDFGLPPSKINASQGQESLPGNFHLDMNSRLTDQFDKSLMPNLNDPDFDPDPEDEEVCNYYKSESCGEKFAFCYDIVVNLFHVIQYPGSLQKASVWGTLAQDAAGQTISSPDEGKQRTQAIAMSSFQQFKKQAKEKADKQRALMEQQELRRRQTEQAEKERLRLEQERKQQKEEEEALERARKSVKPEPVGQVVIK